MCRLCPKKGFPAPEVFSRSVCVVFCNVVSMWWCVCGWWAACTMNSNQIGGYREVGGASCAAATWGGSTHTILNHVPCHVL